MKKPIAHIGIDPGTTGAAVLISENGLDYADFTDAVQFADELRQWADDYDIRLALIELVHSMPQQGVVSVFKFGDVFGQVKGICAALRIPVQLVRPQEWKKGIINKSDGLDQKEAGLSVARRRFPDCDFIGRKKDHNRADALLMAARAAGVM